VNLIAASALALGLFAAPEVPASMPLLAASTRHEPGSTPIVSARREESGEGASDTLRFSPDDESDEEDDESPFSVEDQDDWLRAPIGDHLIMDPDEWASREGGRSRFDMLFDYNRVDPFRLGARFQVHPIGPMLPRFGVRYEYSFGRERGLYGAQIEQPLFPSGRVAFGVSVVRRTDHNELQQVENFENTLAFLLARQDYHDYFEREGFGAYLAWRVPDFSTVSIHARKDDYVTLAVDHSARSWFYRDRDLRENPVIDEGTAHTLSVRLERLAHRTSSTRAGYFHWIDLERAGYQMGGDFEYTRLLGDLRGVFRVSPAMTLALRAVVGRTFDGDLTVQKEFTVGGVDGLRAHPFATYRGDQMALAQAEYTVGIWRLRSPWLQGGLHAMAFVDAGRAWNGTDYRYDLDKQQIRTDGGFGLGTSEDNLRVYFAKNLQDLDSPFVVSLRLQRPF
jgi:hypothetical protein